jgi:creatinine amidohydrolase
MHLADLNWMDVESYLQEDDRVILVTGSTEQHGYLSLLADVRIPMALATAAASREQVLVAPPLNFGVSPDFVEFPGTLSLSEETFHEVLYELVVCLVQHGFRRVLILNGHGGNTLPPQLEALQHDVDGLHIVWYEWFRSPAAEQFASREGLKLAHANWSEAFSFTRVCELPDGEKAPVDLRLETPGMSERRILGDGSFGGPYQVPDETIEHLFNLLLGEVVSILREI